MTELRELMRETVAAAPSDAFDPSALVNAARRRVGRRRRAWFGGISLVVAGGLMATTASLHGGSTEAGTADGPPGPDAPTITLQDARTAVADQDYQVLASHTNEDLDAANGQYFTGVTDDGLVLLQDGPHRPGNTMGWALVDPSTGVKDWLPDPGLDDRQAWPIALGADQLVLLTQEGGAIDGRLVAHVFDRDARTWRTVTWPGLPDASFADAQLGPDGRLYVRVPATTGAPPPGGWPTGPDGEADDADATGDTYHLFSVGLENGSDVRNEQLDVGSFAFAADQMIWSDRTNGHPGRIHIRNLATGAEDAFDAQAGSKCNLLSFGATSDRVVLGEYCGTYAGGVRDDRVQILSTSGGQVATLQGNDLEAGLSGGVVVVDSHQPGHTGTYVYDLATDRLLRLTDNVSKFGMGGGPTPPGLFTYVEQFNHGHGAVQHLAELGTR